MKRALVLVLAFAGACHSGTTVIDRLGLRTQEQLKETLIARYDPFWCDPDSYPLGRPASAVQQEALSWYKKADKTSDEVQAILEKLGLAGTLTNQQIFDVYTEHKRLASVHLVTARDGYSFRVGLGRREATVAVSGIIDDHGVISETGRRKDFFSCPICLSGAMRIATPRGSVRVRDVRAGNLVYTVDHGRRVVRPVLRIVRRPVTNPHLLARLRLADGRSITAAARHPVASGRVLGSFSLGDVLDGSRVTETELIWSNEAFTYDILPAGPTGEYWANGILLRSTLR